MKLTINSKLLLLTGMLLLALCVLGATAFVQTANLEGQLHEITAVAQPASDAAMKMELHALGVGYALFEYLHDHDKRHITQIEAQRASFEQLKDVYDNHAESEEAQRLGAEAAEAFRRFKQIGDEIIQFASSEVESTASFDESLSQIEALLSQRASVSDSAEFQKERLALEMEVHAARIGTNLAETLKLHDDAHAKLLASEEEAFQQALAQFRALELSSDEEKWVVQLSSLYDDSVRSAHTLVTTDHAMSAKIIELETARNDLDRVLGHDVQEKMHGEIEAATLAAHGEVRSTQAIVITVFALGALAGILTALAISRSINLQQSTIREAITRLQSISSEILASTTQQASGMEEQNASVSETVTTMTELGQTVDEAAGRASRVRDVVEKSVEAGDSGRRAVAKSVSAMDKVRSQVKSIAEDNLGLAERAQAIGDIIATVNDVTDQTNLLALNAAVEAARAGDYGKGFGVVAVEIKSLAEQSREATQQVSQILGDIQKATNAAVLATEQGTRDADEATQVVQEAGDTIGLLSQSLEESSRMAAQITASTGQQAIGVKQVNEAMGHLEMVAREQVSATRQVEAAMRDLQSLSHQLGDLVDETGREGQVNQIQTRPTQTPKVAELTTTRTRLNSPVSRDEAEEIALSH